MNKNHLKCPQCNIELILVSSFENYLFDCPNCFVENGGNWLKGYRCSLDLSYNLRWQSFSATKYRIAIFNLSNYTSIFSLLDDSEYYQYNFSDIDLSGNIDNLINVLIAFS